MKRYIFLVFLCLILVNCGGKTTHLITKIKADSIDMLQQGNEAYREGKYRQAAKYFDRARLMAISVDDLELRAEADNNLGHLYIIAGDYDSAENKFKEAMKWSSVVTSKSAVNIVAASYSGRGVVELDRGNFDKAIYWFTSLNKEFLQNDLIAASIHSNLGETYRRKRDFNAASSNLDKALKISLKLNKHILTSTTYYRLSLVERDKDNIEAAELFALKALAEAKKVEYIAGIVRSLELIAELEFIQAKDDGLSLETAKTFEKRARDARALFIQRQIFDEK